MIAMDAEWGVSMRLDKTPRLPMQIVIAASNNIENSYLVSEEIANECKRLGVHMSYSPVADVNINPKNPIIGRRSFGEDKKLVASFAVSAVEAYRNNGIIACGKHFPGHGDTSQDSHKTLPSVNASLERINDVELYPFTKLINNDLPAIMVAHLKIPALEPNSKLPSSLSPRIIDTLLKQKMHYKGLVLSDALNMQGAQSFGSNVEINIQAFKAGNDILVYPLEIDKTVAKFKEEIKSGKITELRLNESVRKILMAKYWAGLGEYSPIDANRIIEDLNNQHSKDIINKVTKESITLIKNKNDVLPLVDVESKIAHLVFGVDKMSEINNRLNDYGKVDNFKVNFSNLNSIKDKIKKYSTIIISVDNPFYYNRKNKSSHRASIKELQSQIKKISKNKIVILNLIGDPYSLSDFGDEDIFDAIIISYKNTKVAQQYTAATIFGANSPKGVLPVTISEKYKVGTSLTFPEIGRLSYSTPELEGMSSIKLSMIDSIVNKAIQDTVMPGGQVLVARNGKIVYNKSFGYKTYEEKEKIKHSDLYDIASLTKIMAATPIVMHLIEEEKLNLDTPMQEYFSELDTTSKADITLRQMMAHYARLQPWIPFFRNTLDENDKPDRKKYYRFNYDSKHKIKVAKNLYLRNDMKDSIIYDVLHSPLLDTLEYKYSDLPYYFIQNIVEKKERKSLDKLASKWFYKPLGLQRISYKPKNTFSVDDIVPSEIDTYFRQKELRGDVNDPGAAMLGGIGGHAGVFSNAYDLAVIMQMFLQEGYYGGKRYFSPSTVEEFTSCQYCDKGNRRGIGFDKPQLEGEGPACDCISYLSFGHSGYTGTMAWADPDEKIVYIFLSNRTYPDSKNTKLVDQNIRTNIQSVIYNAINNVE